MTPFDLLFIVLFLASAGTLLTASALAIRGRGAPALVLLRRLGIGAAAYFGIVVVTSFFWPRTVLRLGEPQCFDDWCIAVDNATRQAAGDHIAYSITLRLFSTARRVSQREYHMAVYLTDDRGRRYDPVANRSDVPLDTLLGPQESIAVTRGFNAPADVRDPAVVITHEGGFSMGWLIIGYETWFHKPAILPLPLSTGGAGVGPRQPAVSRPASLADVHPLMDLPNQAPDRHTGVQEWLRQHPHFKVLHAPIVRDLSWLTLVWRCFEIIGGLPVQVSR